MPFDPGTPNWKLVLQALEALGGRASVNQLEDYFRANFPPDKRAVNVRPESTMLSVNANSRIHYGGAQNKQPRRTDTGHQFDKLFKRQDGAYEFYEPARHGVWEITRDSKGNLGIRQATDAGEPGDIQRDEFTTDRGSISQNGDQSHSGRFALEAHLRDYLAQNLGSIAAFTTKLSLFTDTSGIPGVEYRTDVGIIDVLARGSNDELYVFELKLGRGPDAAVGQILRYIGWLRKHLADGKRVNGVIVAAEISDKLRYAASVVPDISLMEYELQFSLRHAGSVNS